MTSSDRDGKFADPNVWTSPVIPDLTLKSVVLTATIGMVVKFAALVIRCRNQTEWCCQAGVSEVGGFYESRATVSGRSFAGTGWLPVSALDGVLL